MGRATEVRARWHTEPIHAGSVRLHSCLVCGAACCVGSAIKQHEKYHEERGDYDVKPSAG